MKSNIASILEAVKADCKGRGMKVLPPLTEEQRLNKIKEIAKKQYKKSNKEIRETMSEAEFMDKWYSTARRID